MLADLRDRPALSKVHSNFILSTKPDDKRIGASAEIKGSISASICPQKPGLPEFTDFKDIVFTQGGKTAMEKIII